MTATLLSRSSATLFIEDNTYYLADPEDPDSPLWTGEIAPPDVTGLVAAAPGAVAVTCGLHLGDLSVTVEVWDGPPEPDVAGWDDVAETSTTWSVPQVRVCGAVTDEPTEIRVALPPAAHGSYRARAAVRERDAGEDRGAGDPVETHLLQLWPAPPAPDLLLKATDAVGATWRAPVA